MKILSWLKRLFTIRYLCPVCGEWFETKKGMKIHLANKQDEEHTAYRAYHG